MAHKIAQPTCETDANQDIVVVGSSYCCMARRQGCIVVVLDFDANSQDALRARPANRVSATGYSGKWAKEMASSNQFQAARWNKKTNLYGKFGIDCRDQ